MGRTEFYSADLWINWFRKADGSTFYLVCDKNEIIKREELV